MAVSIISKDNQNNVRGEVNSSIDLPFKNYPNYVQIGHFVIGKDGDDGGTPLVVKNLIKKFLGDAKTPAKSGYLDWSAFGAISPVTKQNKLVNNSYIKRYYEMSKNDDSSRKGPFVLLDGFIDQPLNFGVGMNWENNTIENLLKQGSEALTNGLKSAGERLAVLGNSRTSKIGGFVALAGSSVSNLSGKSSDVTSLFTTGSTGWTTTKLPTGGNHLILNINLRKYDLIGDGSPLDMANLLTIFCSPLRSLASQALDLAQTGLANLSADATKIINGTVSNNNGVDANNTSVLDQLSDPTFVWNKYVVSVITNYKKIGAVGTADKSGDIKDTDKIILIPMVITQFNYTPSDNMIVLKDGSVGPTYIEYQLSLSSLMIMSNDELEDLFVVTDDIKTGGQTDSQTNDQTKNATKASEKA